MRKLAKTDLLDFLLIVAVGLFLFFYNHLYIYSFWVGFGFFLLSLSTVFTGLYLEEIIWKKFGKKLLKKQEQKKVKSSWFTATPHWRAKKIVRGIVGLIMLIVFLPVLFLFKFCFLLNKYA